MNTSTEPEKRQPAPKRRLPRAALAPACLIVGAAVSLTLFGKRGESTESTEREPSLAKTTDHVVEVPPTSALNSIDAAIRGQRFEYAIAQCRKAIAENHEDGIRLGYREALSLEGLRRFEDALAAYSKISEAAVNPAIAMLARLGQARCALKQGNVAGALDLLHQLLCEADNGERTGGRGFVEAQYLIAQCELKSLPAVPSPGPLRERAFAWPEFQVDVEQFLDDEELAGAEAADEEDAENPQTTTSNSPRESARAALTAAIDLGPNHLLARAARLALANLDAEDGHERRALAGYRQLLNDDPHAPDSMDAAYNLGLLQLQSGEVREARASFENALDRAPPGRWTDLGWWWLARTHLDEGESERAIRCLHRALAGKSKDVRAAAALGLCTAYLLQGDDDQARAALELCRLDIDDSLTATAQFCETLLRLRNAHTPGRAENFLKAAQTAKEGRSLGLAGVFLAGQAYRELGKHALTLTLYEPAFARARGPLALRAVLSTAECLNELGRADHSRQQFLALLTSGTDPIRARAQFGLAQLSLQAGNVRECLSLCQKLQRNSDADREATLHLMGRAYEADGQFLNAAECFAGRFPVTP